MVVESLYDEFTSSLISFTVGCVKAARHHFVAGRMLTQLTLGGIFFSCVGCKPASTDPILDIQLMAEVSTRLERFEAMYKTEPTHVALSEGTNLVNWLDRRYHVETRENNAVRVKLHSRLHSLFTEAGLSAQAELQAEMAKRYFELITTNVTFSPETVVSNILIHDHVKRQAEVINK